jgi:peptidoglycan hydrolase-like amidase
MRRIMEFSECRRKLSAYAAAVAVCFATLPHASFAAEDEKKSTRPRRVAEGQVAAYAGDGPLIRIGLMSDVTSLALGSASTLVVRHTPGEPDAQQTLASAQLWVEVRQSSRGLREPRSAYQVEVAAVSDSRRARKIAEEIKKEFYQPSSTAYDEQAEKHRILIGGFATKSEAAAMQDRLRRAGYSEARVLGQQQWVQRNAVATAPSNREAYSPKSAANPSTRAGTDESRMATGIAAFEADKLLTSSEESLIVAAEAPKLDTSSHADQQALLRKGSPPPVGAIPTVRVANRDFRGEIHLVLNRRGKINVINVLPLEQYLRGVVPLELSPSFKQIEALKAQAVAARSYALYARGRFSNEGFDLYDDARSQIYGGLTAEHPLTNRAVEETRGMVALYPRNDGRLAPIEALYTANCGGHTENNESMFLTRAVPYLREVKCEPDTNSSALHTISTTAPIEQLTGGDGRSKARDLDLLRASGLDLPDQVTLQYLRAPAPASELESWVTSLARSLGRTVPKPSANDRGGLVEFIRLIASAVYGEGAPRVLLPSSEVDYILGGLSDDRLPSDRRSELAILLKDGVMRLPAFPLTWQVTREYAFETLARALCLKVLSANYGTQGSRLAEGLFRSVAISAEKNRLMVAAGNSARPVGRPSTSLAPPANSGASKAASSSTTKPETPPLHLEFENTARLFRRLGDESYAVARIPIRGGERIVYHVNSAGRVDFLEVELSEAAANSLSASGEWRERLTTDEVKRRLARFRISVGEVEDLLPLEYGASNRVIEMKVVGSEKSQLVRGHHVRSALGLKESLFAIDRERDESDRIQAFIFTGRGWGHGVGLCQIGSVALAKSGYSYHRIIQKYYTGVKIQRIY